MEYKILAVIIVCGYSMHMSQYYGALNKIIHSNFNNFNYYVVPNTI